ncbi:MAG: hypothetical protein AB1640_16675 [bacterium]
MTLLGRGAELSSQRSTAIFVLLLLVMPTFNGCSHLQPIEPEKRNLIRRIAVVSLLGDDMQIKHVGTTVLTNSKSYESVEDWKMDDFATTIVKKAITSDSGYMYVELTGSQDALRKKYFANAKARKKPKDLLTENLVNHVKGELQALASADGADTLIVIVKTGDIDPCAGSAEEFVFGYGVCHRSFLTANITGLFCIAEVIVKDVRTMDTLRSRRAASEKVLDFTLWLDGFNAGELSREEMKTVEKDIKESFSGALTTSLEKLGLIRQGVLSGS